ncbi:MAG TPA: hypothetical protein DHU85_02495 [Porphyromonadaceae bacterium]|nr:hypothetical protein [Porphyromonadaceae bacterium]
MFFASGIFALNKNSFHIVFKKKKPIWKKENLCVVWHLCFIVLRPVTCREKHVTRVFVNGI